jgi:hypothetical protein
MSCYRVQNVEEVEYHDGKYVQRYRVTPANMARSPLTLKPLALTLGS